jgi:hypothetical protein
MEREPISHLDTYLVGCEIKTAARQAEDYFTRLHNAIAPDDEAELFRSLYGQAKALAARLKTQNESMTGQRRGRDMAKRGAESPPLDYEDVLQSLHALTEETHLIYVKELQSEEAYTNWHAGFSEVLPEVKKLKDEIGAVLYAALNRPRARA